MVSVPENRQTILAERCRSCRAAVWFEGDEWKCSMCSRPFFVPIVDLPEVADAQKAIDSIDEFLDECCVVEPREQIATGRLYGAYARWCRGNHRPRLTKMVFARQLKSRGFEPGRTSQVRLWRGLRCPEPAASA